MALPKINMLWKSFLNADKEDSTNKNIWLELFLYEYNKLDDEDKKYFDLLNSSDNISSELSKHMLFLIYELCENTTTSISKVNDLESVLSLRSFLLEGVGGRILRALQKMGTKNIINSRELANVLIRLFPTKDWNSNSQRELEEYDGNNGLDTVMSVFKVKTHSLKTGVRKNSLNINTSQLFLSGSKAEQLSVRKKLFKVTQSEPTIPENYNDLITASTSSQDEFSLSVLNVLEDMIVNENILTIDENSISIKTLNFAIDNLGYSRPNCLRNQFIIRQKLIEIIIYCLNNIFLMENIAEEYIQISQISSKLMSILEKELLDAANQVQESEIKVNYVFSIIYTVLIVINSTFLYFSDNVVNEKYFLAIFKILCNLETTKKTYSYLRKNKDKLSTKLVEILIKIFNNLKVSTSGKPVKKNRKIRSKNHHVRKYSNISYVCALESILLNLFPLVKYGDQKMLLNFFEENQICCCNLNIETLEIAMKLNNDEVIPKICLNFAAKNVVAAIFSESNCDFCESEKYSNDFHDNFIKIYQKAFEEYRKERHKSKFPIFLKHLLDILKILPFRLSKYFIEDVVLPTFRDEKAAFLESDDQISRDIVNSCLMVIYNSLKDVNLFKLFFNIKNIQHINELSTCPEFIYHVCRILKVGIQNINYFDVEFEEKLLSILFENIERLTVILNSHIANLAQNHLSIDLNVPEEKRSPTYQLPHKAMKKLSVTTMTMLYTEYWKTILQLLQSNEQFNILFLRRYSSDGLQLLHNLFSLILYNVEKVVVLDPVHPVPERRSLLNVFHFNDNLTDFHNPIADLDYEKLELFNLKQKFSDIVDGYFTKKGEKVEDSLQLVQNNFVKKKLAVIFELILCCYLLISPKDAELDEKMQSSLYELKKLLLSTALQDWESVENGKNIMNGIQSLLKVAEIRNLPLDDQKEQSCIEDDDSEYYFPTQSFDCSINYNEYDDRSSSDESYTTADDGYDGDVENNNEIQRSSAVETTKKQSTKINQNICSIVIEILIDLSRRCVFDPDAWVPIIAQMILKLNVVRKYLGGSLYLIKGFVSVLEKNDNRLIGLQTAILELITDLNSPESFSSYISIFSLENPPVQLLLSKLIQLYESSEKIQNYIEIEFPSSKNDLTRSSTCDFLLAKKTNYLREHHTFFSLKSSFSEAAKIIPLNYINFYPWCDDGFTATLWFNIKSGDELKHEMTHLISVGTEKQILSLFMTLNRQLYVKFSKPDTIITTNNTKLYFAHRANISCCDNCTKEIRHLWTFKHLHQNTDNLAPLCKIETPNAQCVYCYKHLSNMNAARMINLNRDYDYNSHEELVHVKEFTLIENKWTMLSFSVKQMEKVMMVHLTLDGVQEQSFELQNPGKIHINTNLSLLSIGHNWNDGRFVQYSLSNVSIFRKYVDDPVIYANLYALGPNCIHFGDNMLPNYGSLNFSKMEINDFEGKKCTKFLQKSLAGVFSSHKPDIFVGYKKDGSEIPLGMLTFSADDIFEQKSLQKSVILSGGISVILFMFARIVELAEDVDQQAAALSLLLKMAHSNNELYTEFYQNNYLNLIGVVLKNKKCKKDLKILNAVFEITFDSPVLIKRNETFVVFKNSNARVKYPEIILFLLQNVSIWIEKDEEILSIFFDVLTTLVRDKHPGSVYNRNRLMNAGIVPVLLDFCRVNFVIPPQTMKIPRSAADSLVTLISNLSDQPPKLELLNEIKDLLLLMHRPTDSYVTHDRFKFYFNLAPFLSNKPNKNSENKLTQRLQLKERKTKYSQVRKAMNLNVVVEPEETVLIGKIDINVKERRSNNITQNGYYERLNVALANPQIKRKCRSKSAKSRVRRLDSPGGVRNPLALNGKERHHSAKLCNIEEIKKSPQFSFKISKFLTQNNLETGNDFIQESFLNALKLYILILPDEQAEEFLSSENMIVEILLILSNNPNVKIRTLIIDMLSVIIDRLSTNSLNQYTKILCWHHLGNQIASHPINIEIVNACLKWITKSNVKLTLESNILDLKIEVIQKNGLNVLVSILPQAAQEQKLFMLTVHLIESIYLKNPDASQYMLENGLLWALVKTVIKIHENFNRQNFNRILVLLTTISYKSLISSSVNILWDIMNGLMFARKHKNPEIASGVRNIHALLYKNLLQKCVYKSTESLIGFKINSFVVNLPGCNFSQTEMKSRFNLLYDKSIQFITNHETSTISEEEMSLIEVVMQISLNGNPKEGNVIIWSLIPSKPLALKLYTIKQLCAYLDKGNYLSNVCDSKKLKILVQSVLLVNQENIAAPDFKLVTQFYNSLEGPHSSSWNLSQILEEIEISRGMHVKDQEQVMLKSIYRGESLVQYCTEKAMEITRNIVEKQNKIRKVLLNRLRSENGFEYFKQWGQIVQNLTHEGAPWHNPTLYPSSWELDNTEGADMVHKRLRRCHMTIDKKFILKEFYNSSCSTKQLLSYLQPSNGYQDFAVKEQVLYTFNVKHITVKQEAEGECILTDSQLVLTSNVDEPIVHNLHSIKEIWAKRYQHRDAALEIFMKDGNSVFIVFQTIEEREIFEGFFENLVQKMGKQKMEALSLKWRDGELTNFEYLMQLNQISGRTFNDLMQYPVFPWILSDYKAQVLNLLSENVYRNFERPIASQNKDQERQYITNYNYLKQALSDTLSRNNHPYHYSSHYSNSGTVLHFLVRMLPFTSLFLQYQDNSFDIPDRTFHSLNTTWLLASRDSPTDVKELTPEFFYFPEFLENLEGFDFGNRQSGESVHHVQLPKWCDNSARLFTLIHRQALESDVVRKRLSSWIDLIFGHKQIGQAAIEAVNVFHPATYSDFTACEIKDPVERLACETMVKTYGQMPRQLFENPHPQANVTATRSDIPVLESVVGLKWGFYTGSPILANPKMVDIHIQKQFNVVYNNLIHLKKEDKIFGVPGRCNMIKGNYLVHWNEVDDIVRIKSLTEDSSCPVEKIVHSAKLDPITCCGTDTNSSDIWFGHKSGRISVYQRKSLQKAFFNKNTRPRLNSISSNFISFGKKHWNLKRNEDMDDMEGGEWKQPVVLIKHSDEVTEIKLCLEFKIAVSVSLDGTAAIWDLNTLEYVREIPKPVNVLHSAIIMTAISSTLGDIVTAHSNISHHNHDTTSNPSISIVDDESFEVTENNMDDYVKISMSSSNSQIRLYTLNAKYVNHVFVEDNVTAINYSYVKEGSGVNSVVVALESGLIKFYSSWNLALVKELNIGANLIIKSLLFSKHQYLIILTNDNVIQVWKSEGLQGNSPKFPQINFSKDYNI